MVKKTIIYLWSLRRQFVKYFLVGISSFAIGVTLLKILVDLGPIRLAPVPAVMVVNLITLGYNFSLNKYWSFRNRAMPHKQLVRYLVLSGADYLFGVGAMYLFHERLGFAYLIVYVGSVAVMVGWNFFLYKYWIYKEASPEPTSLSTDSRPASS